MNSPQEAAALIERAMAGVTVVPCARCKGFGEIGLMTLPATCPACRGAGVTTTKELEVQQDA